jgi:glycogen operon protein
VALNGQAIPDPDEHGERVVDDTFHILFNAHWEPIPFVGLGGLWGQAWAKIIDTTDPIPDLRESAEILAGQTLLVQAYSLAVLRKVR